MFTHFQLVPRLRISGNITPRTLYDFMSLAGTNLLSWGVHDDDDDEDDDDDDDDLMKINVP
jgi:hypothetical protein